MKDFEYLGRVIVNIPDKNNESVLMFFFYRKYISKEVLYVEVEIEKDYYNYIVKSRKFDEEFFGDVCWAICDGTGRRTFTLSAHNELSTMYHYNKKQYPHVLFIANNGDCLTFDNHIYLYNYLKGEQL